MLWSEVSVSHASNLEITAQSLSHVIPTLHTGGLRQVALALPQTTYINITPSRTDRAHLINIPAKKTCTKPHWYCQFFGWIMNAKYNTHKKISHCPVTSSLVPQGQTSHCHLHIMYFLVCLLNTQLALRNSVTQNPMLAWLCMQAEVAHC